MKIVLHMSIVKCYNMFENARKYFVHLLFYSIVNVNSSAKAIMDNWKKAGESLFDILSCHTNFIIVLLLARPRLNNWRSVITYLLGVALRLSNIETSVY